LWNFLSTFDAAALNISVKTLSQVGKIMRTCIDHLISQPHLDVVRVRNEVEYLTGRLETCLQDGVISNDAYLDAGAITGALEMVANHIDAGIPQKEVGELLRQQLERAERLETKHPGLNQAIESGRN